MPSLQLLQLRACSITVKWNHEGSRFVPHTLVPAGRGAGPAAAPQPGWQSGTSLPRALGTTAEVPTANFDSSSARFLNILPGAATWEVLLRISMTDSDFSALTTPEPLLKSQNFGIKMVPPELHGALFNPINFDRWIVAKIKFKCVLEITSYEHCKIYIGAQTGFSGHSAFTFGSESMFVSRINTASQQERTTSVLVLVIAENTWAAAYINTLSPDLEVWIKHCARILKNK